MLTNSHKQLDNCLKDVYKPLHLTCVLKHQESHREPYVTPFDRTFMNT